MEDNINITKLERPYMYITSPQKAYFDMVKHSTIIDEVSIDYYFSAWPLAVDALSQNKSITKMKMWVAVDVEKQSKAIAEILSANPRIKKLTLVVQPAPDRGEDPNLELIAQAIKSNRHLEDLFIDTNLYQFNAIRNIFESMKAHPTLRRIKARINYQILAETIDLICDLLKETPNINALCLMSESTMTTDAVELLKSVTRVTTLTRLELEQIFFGGELLATFLKQLMPPNTCTLKMLHIHGGNINDDEVRGSLLGEFLAANLSIESLRLSYLELEEESAKIIARGLEQNNTITELDLANNNSLDNLVPVLCNHPSITSLDFKGNSLTEAQIGDFVNNRKLRTLKLAPIQSLSLNVLWNSIKFNQTLTELDLAYYGLSGIVLDQQAMHEMMEANRSLRKLILDERITLNTPEIINFIPSFTERNKLEQRMNISNTLHLIAMLLKHKDFRIRLPRETWCHILSFISFPGVVLNFGSVLEKKFR